MEQKNSFVSVKKISELLMVKEKTIYQWAETGMIPCYKMNGVLRFAIHEVQEWVKSCKKEPVHYIIKSSGR